MMTGLGYVQNASVLLNCEVTPLLSVTLALTMSADATLTLKRQVTVEVVVPLHPAAGRPLHAYVV